MAALQLDVYVADYFTDSFADVASFVGVYSQSDGFLHLMPLTWEVAGGGRCPVAASPPKMAAARAA
eukprot:4099184-Pyramimonas_sp.AAC.1